MERIRNYFKKSRRQEKTRGSDHAPGSAALVTSDVVSGSFVEPETLEEPQSDEAGSSTYGPCVPSSILNGHFGEVTVNLPTDIHFIHLDYFTSRNIYDFSILCAPRKMMQRVLFQVGSGLAYLHANNIIHRDIRGQAVLVNPRYQVKITNLDNAAYGPVAPGFYGAGYAPPNVLLLYAYGISSPCSFASDLYALGVTIYILNYGDFPCTYDGEHVYYPFEMLDTEYRCLLKGLLHKNPTYRISNTKDYLEHGFFTQRDSEVDVCLEDETESHVSVTCEGSAEPEGDEIGHTVVDLRENEEMIKMKEQELEEIHEAHTGTCEKTSERKRKRRDPFKRSGKKEKVKSKNLVNESGSVLSAEGTEKFKKEPQCPEESSGKKDKKKKTLLRRILHRINPLRKKKEKKDPAVLMKKQVSLPNNHTEPNDAVTCNTVKTPGTASQASDINVLQPRFPEKLQEHSGSAKATGDGIKSQATDLSMEKVETEKQEKKQTIASTSSSLFATSSSSSKGPKLVNLLKDLKLKDTQQKLAPNVADGTSNISNIKLVPPPSAKASKSKKEFPIVKMPTAQKFLEETQKNEDKPFDPFSSEKKIVETKPSPWVAVGQEECTPIDNLDFFQTAESLFNDAWSKPPSTDPFAVWGHNNDQPWTANEKNNENFDNFFAESFNADPSNIQTHGQKPQEIAESLEKNENSIQAVKKKKNLFKWVSNLFSWNKKNKD